MKIFVSVAFFFFLLTQSVQAQFNYIPNGDFEEYTECPGAHALIENVKPWYNPNDGTCDFFHECSLADVDVPQNFFGYQEAFSGKGYAGFGLLSYYLNENLDTISSNEYLTVPLVQPLDKNEIYCLSFAISNSDSVCLAFKSLQVYISKDKIQKSDNDVGFKLNRPYQLEFDISEVPLDDWIVLSESFKAKGGEKFVSFGFFRQGYTLLKKKCAKAESWQNLNYYFIDKVQLFKLEESTCTYVAPKVNIPNVFTPNGDEFNDVFFVSGLSGTLTIINRWGQTLFEGDAETGWDGTITSNGKKAVDGVYFYLFMDEEGNQQQGYLHLVGNE